MLLFAAAAAALAVISWVSTPAGFVRRETTQRRPFPHSSIVFGFVI
jgi:hypothetical protein